MKITLKTIAIVALTALLVIGSTIPCFAQEQQGRITVTLEDAAHRPINGITVNASRIAQLNSTGYYPAEGFETSRISIAGIVNNPDETAAKAVADYVKQHRVPTVSATTDHGKATFTDLALGIWLVFPEEGGAYTFNPYIVFLPYEAGGKLYYDVKSAPKPEDNTPNSVNIYVVKKWDDKNNAAKKRPARVTVELLDGDAVVASVDLSEENGWAHTFSALPKGGDYTVREKAVDHYRATYSGDAENGFVVTNTYDGEKLPQTGQHWWPIGALAVAGICFVILGIYEMGAKKHGEKR